MPFQKDNEYAFKRQEGKKLDPKPLCIRLDPEIKQQLVSIPGWQDKLRNALPSLISKWSNLTGG